ncbi:MAG: hypothetical protein NE327_16695, partial [Lentisphaeraceae bacterium]|nr:hypothetical protein [Lentisphaeraceae bacterium]
EIDEAIKWEAGPGQSKEYFLAFSPGYNVDKLSITKAMISEAPELNDWEFLPAKPRKSWTTRTVYLPTQNGEIELNFDKWKYSLTSFNKGEFYDVNLTPDVLPELITNEEIERAGYFLVQSEIGQLMFLEFVDRVNIVFEPKTNLIEIDHLYDQLSDLTV